MRKAQAVKPITPYVVYVTYPGGSKEYAYGCDLPNVGVNSYLKINNAGVIVRRVEHRDPGDLNWIPSSFAVAKYNRALDIKKRLTELEAEESLLARWSKLRSPEAKKLVAELKELCK
jgi:hypothetical protein